jgi:O-antigen ligase/polysaccharide polymerase Wzy-like membrane protein
MLAPTTDIATQEHLSSHNRLSLRSGILAALVVGYILLLPYQFQLGKTMNLAPADCFLALAVILGVAQLRWISTVWTAWHLGMVLIFVVGSLVCALNYGVLASYELLNKDLGLVIPFLSYLAITSVVNNWDGLRLLLRLFVMSVVLQNILAIAAYFAAHFFGVATSFAQYEGLRLSGMLLDPNAYGGLLAMTLVICEAASSGQMPLFQGRTLMLSRMTLTTGILFTFSRSAWLGLGLALLLLCLLRIQVAGRLFGSLLLGAPCLLLLIGPTFVSVIGDMASRPKQVQERFDLIQLALQAFQRHPLFGGGLGSFRLTVGEIAHNSAMWFLADFGILGLGVFLGFLAWFFSRAWVAYQSAPSHQQPLVLALLLAHTTMAGVAMGIEAFYQRHWWLVFALIGSAYTLTRRSLAETQLECPQTRWSL